MDHQSLEIVLVAQRFPRTRGLRSLVRMHRWSPELSLNRLGQSRSPQHHSTHQYAMSSGCECIAHIQDCHQNDHATVLFVDGIGAFDLVSRESMLRVEGDSGLLLVRQFCGSLGKLQTVSSTTSLKRGWKTWFSLACNLFLDGVMESADRVVPIFNLFQRELWIHSRIEVHSDQVWNRGGFEPFSGHLMTVAAQGVHPSAVVVAITPSC